MDLLLVFCRTFQYYLKKLSLNQTKETDNIFISNDYTVLHADHIIFYNVNLDLKL